jgi:hypothetical protein
MSWLNEVLEWGRGLSPCKVDKRWVLYATIRNSPGTDDAKWSNGVHGVRREELLEAIWSALERAYEFLLAQGRKPLAADIPPVQVYVFAVDDPRNGCGNPLTTQAVHIKPDGAGQALRFGTVIMLPSRSSEPQWYVEKGQTLAAVVHELSHSFNLEILPFLKYHATKHESPEAIKLRWEWIDSWRWLDEGMAVAAEASFREQERQKTNGLPITNDWLRYALDWVDRPERSLDDPQHDYQAAFFVRYLERLMGGPKFLNEVWNLSECVWSDYASKDCSALTMMDQYLHGLTPALVFCSATEPDVFASGYCLDSYFLNDPDSKAYEPEVFARFKERAITRTWRMKHKTKWPDGKTEHYSLPGLACRYFRFMPMKEVRRLVVRVLPGPGGAAGGFCKLKAEVVFAFARPGNSGHCRQRPDGFSLRQTLVTLVGSGELACEIPAFSTDACDHAVLVVTNCDYASPPSSHLPPTGYRQSAEFCVAARLM